MPVDLVLRGVEERVLFVWAVRDDRRRGHDPDRHAFAAPGVDIARVTQRPRGVWGVQAAHVLVGQAAPGADEHLPEGPAALAGFAAFGHDARTSGLACLSA